ncbi:MAG: APC family permease [Clostridiales bacterium]|nr:APC family permease [Clostridiales bacterium]
MENNNGGLKRQLSPMSVWALAFGCVIGWGSFINPGKKFLPNSGVYGTAIAMILGALVMVIIAFSYAYMVPKFPKAGGEFTFTKNCYGKTMAFVCGWFLVVAYLTNVPMNSTALPLIVDGLDGDANILKFGFNYSIAGNEVWLGEILFACFILLLFGFLNILGVRKAGFIQTILAVLLATCAFTLCIAGVVSAKAKGINMEPVWGFSKAAAKEAGFNGTTQLMTADALAGFDNASKGSSGIIAAVLATFAIAPWAFVGFDTIPQAAEEFKFSYKKVMGIMVLAIAFGAFVYISNNTVAAAAQANWPDRVMSGEWVLLIAAEELLGTFGKVLVGVGVSCAVLSGIMGFYLASSRLMYSMSRDGYLPAVFGKVGRFNTPWVAMLFCIIVSLAGPILGREALGWFVDMSAIGASIGYFFTCAATLRTMRKDGDGSLKLKILAIIGVIFSAAFMILQLIPMEKITGIDAFASVHFGKESYIMLIIWVVLGAAFYFWQKKKFSNKLDDEGKN